MTDLRFDDVVDTTRMIGSDGKYAKAVCKTCSQQHSCDRSEFINEEIQTIAFEDGELNWEPLKADPSQEKYEYIASMRAWNCCHEGEEPLDGFPEQPDLPIGFEFEQ